MDLIIKLLNSLIPYGDLAYLIMFLLLLFCGFGLPLPEDVVLVTGGILASKGVTEFWITFMVTMLGVLMGDSIIFLIGKTYGERIKKTRFFRIFISPERDKKIKEKYDKYGSGIIFVARFMPGLRMPIFLSTGIYGAPYLKFLSLDGFAALISVPVWIYVGEIFGNNLEALDQKIKSLQFGIYGVLAAAILLLFLFLYLKKRFAHWLG